MKYLSTLSVLLFISASALSQTLTPKFGLEVAGSVRKTDAYTAYNSPAPVGYIGFYTNVPVSKQFSVKFGAGLNRNFVKRDDVKGFMNEHGIVYPDSVLAGEKTSFTTMSVSAELRFYLLPGSPSWGNFYAMLPITLESATVTKWSGTRPELKITPGFGYRYEFCKHWGLEVNAGLGWGKYTSEKINDISSSTLEYTASLRVGYTF